MNFLADELRDIEAEVAHLCGATGIPIADLEAEIVVRDPQMGVLVRQRLTLISQAQLAQLVAMVKMALAAKLASGMKTPNG